MKVLCHQLILVAVLITGRTDAVPERSRREEEQVPQSNQVKSYPVSSLNFNTEDHSSAEIGEGNIGKVINLQAPNGFSFDDSNEEAGEGSLGKVINLQTPNDFSFDDSSEEAGEGSLGKVITLQTPNGFSTDDSNEEVGEGSLGKVITLQTPNGFSIDDSNEEVGEGSMGKVITLQNPNGFSIDDSSEEAGEGSIGKVITLQTPNGLSFDGSNEASESSETEANALTFHDGEDKVNVANNFDESNVKEITHLPHGPIPLLKPSKNSGDIKNTFKANPTVGAHSELLNKSYQEPRPLYARLPNKVPSNPSYAYGNSVVVTTPRVDTVYTGPVDKYTQFYQQNHPISSTGIEKNKLMANEYEVTRSSNWIPYQKGNVPYTKTNNWNPYTKPTEGETLIQAEKEIQSRAKTVADLTAGENGNRRPNLIPYQKQNLNKPLVPNEVFQNGYKNNGNWNPYTKPTEGETLVQAEGKIQENGDQSSKLIQYQKENPNKPLVPINVFQNGYNNNKNWSPYTKPAEGETLVKAGEKNQYREKSVADLAAQENGDRSPKLIQYQKENPNKPLVPINVFQNGYNNNKNWSPYTKPAEGETLVQAGEINQYREKAIADLAAQENGDRSPKLIQYQKENPNKPLAPNNLFQNGYNYNKNWSPYTKPAEGETLVQVEKEIQNNGKAEANIAAQENGNRSPNLLPYQKVSLNGYNNNKNWNPYTKPAEGETLIQAQGELQSTQLNSRMQYKSANQDNIVAQSNDGFHYSEENKITSATEFATKTPTNIASSYSRGLATTQMSNRMKYSGPQESSVYGNTNQYNNVNLNGLGNANSYLQNVAQFGPVMGVAPPGQAGPVLETRFGQTTHPAYRPLSAFGSKHPNQWNHW